MRMLTGLGRRGSGVFAAIRSRAEARSYGLLLMMGVTALGGCGGSPVNTVLSQQIELAIGRLAPESLQVRIINQNLHTEEVDLLVDGVIFTLICTPEAQVCDVLMPVCPTRVEVLQERQLDDQGRFLGGRIFNGSEMFIFHRPGDFQCGSVLILRFSDQSVEAMVL